MDSTISMFWDKVLPMIEAHLDSYTERLEKGWNCVEDNRKVTPSIALLDKGIIITPQGFVTRSLTDLPSVDLKKDRMVLYVDFSLLLDYTEDFRVGDCDLAFTQYETIESPAVARAEGLEGLLTKLKALSTREFIDLTLGDLYTAPLFDEE
jgi:hypothetical protein